MADKPAQEPPAAARFLTVPFENVPEQDVGNPYEPTEVHVYDVGLRAASGRVALYYAGVSKPIRVRDHSDFTNRLPDIIAAPRHPAPAPRQPMQSPLSVHNAGLSYVVFRLDRGWNWQFAARGPVLTIEQGRTAYFREARRVDDNGATTDRNNRQEIDGAMAAYFIAHGRKARRDSGAKDSYSHEFNLHVEFLERDTGGTVVSRLPVIIDPDIRYPGGN
ncbi:MAG: nucleotide synthetase [Rhodothalassiaceae bacterium]